MRNELIGYEAYNRCASEMLKRAMNIPIEILNQPFSPSWIGYHMGLTGKFEALTEYNGFLVEV